MEPSEAATRGVLWACNFTKKETLAQVFSCEFCEILKNTFFTELLRMTASESSLRGVLRDVFNICGKAFCENSSLLFLQKGYSICFAGSVAAIEGVLLCGSLFLISSFLISPRSATLLKRDSNTCVYL